MRLEQVKSQWLDYVREFETTEEMDIEKHINMALNVGGLLVFIEELLNQIENE